MLLPLWQSADPRILHHKWAGGKCPARTTRGFVGRSDVTGGSFDFDSTEFNVTYDGLTLNHCRASHD